MNAIEHYATLNLSLVRRFKAARGRRGIEDIAKDVGISHVTIYAWLSQERITRPMCSRRSRRGSRPRKQRNHP